MKRDFFATCSIAGLSLLFFPIVAFGACADFDGAYKGREVDGGRVVVRLKAGKATSFSYNGKSFSIRSFELGKTSSKFKAGKSISISLSCKSNGQLGYAYRDGSGYSARATLRK